MSTDITSVAMMKPKAMSRPVGAVPMTAIVVSTNTPATAAKYQG